MKERMQKISAQNDNCPQKSRTASEDYVGVQTFIGITENNLIEVRLLPQSRIVSKDPPWYRTVCRVV